MELNNYRIRGRLNDSKKGGVFFGFCSEKNTPVFGGGNLIYAPIWWNTTKDRIEEVCKKIKALCPECECYPEKC